MKAGHTRNSWDKQKPVVTIRINKLSRCTLCLSYVCLLVLQEAQIIDTHWTPFPANSRERSVILSDVSDK